MVRHQAEIVASKERVNKERHVQQEQQEACPIIACKTFVNKMVQHTVKFSMDNKCMYHGCITQSVRTYGLSGNR